MAILSTFSSELGAECITAVANYLKTQSSSENPSKPQSVNLLLKSVERVTSVLLSILCLCVIVVTCFNPQFISETLGHDNLGRIASISFDFHKLKPFHDVNTKYCFLVNPFFELADPHCKLCKHVHEAITVNQLSKFPENLLANQVPFMIKNAFSAPIKLDLLKEFLHKFDLDGFQPKLDSHMKLETNQYSLTKALGRVIPSPKNYIPTHFKLFFHSYLLIDGPSSSSYSMPNPAFKNVFVMQAQGRRVIKLMPSRKCRATCASVSISLETGDILFYNWHFWTAVSVQVSDTNVEQDSSITKMGSYFSSIWELFI